MIIILQVIYFSGSLFFSITLVTGDHWLKIGLLFSRVCLHVATSRLFHSLTSVCIATKRRVLAWILRFLPLVRLVRIAAIWILYDWRTLVLEYLVQLCLVSSLAYDTGHVSRECSLGDVLSWQMFHLVSWLPLNATNYLSALMFEILVVSANYLILVSFVLFKERVLAHSF